MSAQNDLVNRSIGKYRCINRIATGGTSTVYKAQTADGRSTVAIKVLKPQAAKDATVRKALDQEFKLLGGLSHPGLLRYLDLGEQGGNIYLVMEYFDSLSLKRRLASEFRPWLVKTADRVVVQVAEALDYIHEQGIIHRDVKPENVLVDENGACKLIDFSFAIRGMRCWLPFARTAVGTPSYVAPEQLLKKPITRAADIYAFGALLYELVAGRPPFTGEKVAEVIARKLQTDPSPVSRYNRDAAPGLDKLLSELLSRSPADRPIDLSAFLRQFAKTGLFRPTEAK